MLYLRNITSSQIVLIPKSGKAVLGNLVFKAVSTIDKSIVFNSAVIDINSSVTYYNIALTLPSGLADGEYQYTLSDDGGVLETGLLILAGGENTIIQYNRNVTYKQYGQ